MKIRNNLKKYFKFYKNQILIIKKNCKTIKQSKKNG